MSVKTDSEKAAMEAKKLEEAQEGERLEQEATAKAEADAAAKLEADQAAENAKQEAALAAALPVEQFTKIADEFGAEIAAQTVRDGGDYNTALHAYADGLKTENGTLREKVAELTSAQDGGQAAKVIEAAGKPKRVFNSNK